MRVRVWVCVCLSFTCVFVSHAYVWMHALLCVCVHKLRVNSVCLLKSHSCCLCLQGKLDYKPNMKRHIGAHHCLPNLSSFVCTSPVTAFVPSSGASHLSCCFEAGVSHHMLSAAHFCSAHRDTQSYASVLSAFCSFFLQPGTLAGGTGVTPMYQVVHTLTQAHIFASLTHNLNDLFHSSYFCIQACWQEAQASPQCIEWCTLLHMHIKTHLVTHTPVLNLPLSTFRHAGRWNGCDSDVPSGECHHEEPS